MAKIRSAKWSAKTVAVSYKLFELTNTLKIAFVPGKDDKRLMYNVITSVVLSTVIHTISFILLKLPQAMVTTFLKRVFN
ncbi:hypothetical protein Hdeb2414_s0023g00629461 [Helianthus debilis subsp. tardiflorus]